MTLFSMQRMNPFCWGNSPIQFRASARDAEWPFQYNLLLRRHGSRDFPSLPRTVVWPLTMPLFRRPVVLRRNIITPLFWARSKTSKQPGIPRGFAGKRVPIHSPLLNGKVICEALRMSSFSPSESLDVNHSEWSYLSFGLVTVPLCIHSSPSHSWFLL